MDELPDSTQTGRSHYKCVQRTEGNHDIKAVGRQRLVAEHHHQEEEPQGPRWTSWGRMHKDQDEEFTGRTPQRQERAGPVKVKIAGRSWNLKTEGKQQKEKRKGPQIHVPAHRP